MLVFNQLGRMGRVGNQMHQIASTIGLATKHGYDYAFPYWMNYDEKERFSGTDDIDIQKYFKNPLPLFEGELPEHNIKWGYHDLTLPDNISLSGHMQSEKYFKKQTEERVNTVAVHFRGGDYGGDYHPTCTREYYEQARSYFDNGFKFLLFTDDPERARDVVQFPFELVDEPDPIKTLELMTRCDAHIIANSTFSWWGAWLADSRRVIAPKTWFGTHRHAPKDTSDIYPEDWIVI